MAQSDLPALFEVSAEGLAIHAGPNQSSRILGDARETVIEAVAQSADGLWLMVNVDEQVGWLPSDELKRLGPDWQAGLPDPIFCFGTEPFWSLRQNGTTVRFDDTVVAVGLEPTAGSPRNEVTGQEFSITYSTGTLGSTPAYQFFQGSIRREVCSDGMSDRAYGISIRLTRIDSQSGATFNGCCTLQI